MDGYYIMVVNMEWDDKQEFGPFQDTASAEKCLIGLAARPDVLSAIITPWITKPGVADPKAPYAAKSVP